METTNTPSLSDTLTQHANAVNAVHILGTMIFIYLVATAWYHSSEYITKNKKSRNIEPYLRWVLLFNLCLMCIAFPGFAMSRYLHIGAYYVTYNIKQWNEVSCDDYPSSYLYLVILMLPILSLHHTINVVRISYELQKSTHVLRNYCMIILIIHSLIYLMATFVWKCNPFILWIITCVIDYPQHLILTFIYLTRMKQEFKRNIWGLVGAVAHMIAPIPVLYEGGILASDKQTSDTESLAALIMYFLGFLNFLGWYKLFMNTPNEFLVNEPIKCDDEEDVEITRASHVVRFTD